MPLSSYVSGDVFLHIPCSLQLRVKRAWGSSDLTEADRPEESEQLNDGANKALWHLARRRTPANRRLTVVFFITGNPGLVSYYRPFLARIVQRVDDAATRGDQLGDVIVAAYSLGGFEIDPELPTQQPTQQGPEVRAHAQSQQAPGGLGVDEVDDLLYPFPFMVRHQPKKEANARASICGKADNHGYDGRIYNLEEQIDLSFTRLEELVTRLQEEQKVAVRPAADDARDARFGNDSEDCNYERPIRVILIGHSVGAFIALEMVRLWHERYDLERVRETTEAPARGGDISGLSANHAHASRAAWMVSTCILLTPTIKDIHLSPSGRMASPLLSLSFLPWLAHTVLHAVMTRVLSEGSLCWLVQRITGMQPRTHGFDATMAFLRSPSGIHQALHMASWEMKQIRADRWGLDVWEASNISASGPLNASHDGSEMAGSKTGPLLYFWFAAADHWVADVTREEIVNGWAGGVVERGTIDETVEVEGVDEGVPHRECQIRGRILVSQGLKHAWCLEQSEVVAHRVADWLEQDLRDR